jgi:hypothetical protein
MKDAQIAKQVEYRKQTQQNHYGPPQQQDIQYGRNDNSKRSNTTYGRDNYQGKRSQNDRGRSPSIYRSNSHTRSQRSPGDNHRNGATFYYDKNKYKNLPTTPDFTQHHRNSLNSCSITQTSHHSSKEQKNIKTHKKKR